MRSFFTAAMLTMVLAGTIGVSSAEAQWRRGRAYYYGYPEYVYPSPTYVNPNYTYYLRRIDGSSYYPGYYYDGGFYRGGRGYRGWRR